MAYQIKRGTHDRNRNAKTGRYSCTSRLSGKQNEKPLPCIVFYHGFTSSSLVYSYFAVALAQAGFRVIMPDAPDHGLRFSGDAGRRMYHFWQILHKNMEEFSAIREGLLQKNGCLMGVLR